MITTTFNRDALIRAFANLLAQRYPRWRGWLEGDGYSIYVRIIERFVTVARHEQVKMTTLDLSRIIFEPQHQSQGHFTALLKWLKTNSEYPIYIENVLDNRLAIYLCRQGFIMQLGMTFAKSFVYVRPTHEG